MSVITGYVAALLSFGVRSGPKIIIVNNCHGGNASMALYGRHEVK